MKTNTTTATLQPIAGYASQIVDFCTEEVFRFLAPLSLDYPDFENWYWGKVVPGLNNGARTIKVYYRDGEISAAGIGKMEPSETKLCTVRVSPTYQGSGIGLRVFEDMFELLGTRKPFLSVGARKLSLFSRIFKHYGFVMTSTFTDLYGPNTVEYMFNEPRLMYLGDKA